MISPRGYPSPVSEKELPLTLTTDIDTRSTTNIGVNWAPIRTPHAIADACMNEPLYAKFGSKDYMSDRSDFCLPSYGSVSEFRLGTEQSRMGSTGFGWRFTPRVRNGTVTWHMEVCKVRQIPCGPQLLLRNALTPRNCEL